MAYASAKGIVKDNDVLRRQVQEVEYRLEAQKSDSDEEPLKLPGKRRVPVGESQREIRGLEKRIRELERVSTISPSDVYGLPRRSAAGQLWNSLAC